MLSVNSNENHYNYPIPEENPLPGWGEEGDKIKKPYNHDIIGTHYGYGDEIEENQEKLRNAYNANICPVCEEDSIEPGKRLCYTCNDKVRAGICTSCNNPVKKKKMPLAGIDYLGRCVHCSGTDHCVTCGVSPIKKGALQCESCKQKDNEQEYGIR